ncbi:MAG: IPTL-CTERM sorting domain-containing protein [Curvibacter sp.]|nr:IPTL-CTERM sorting domain-containing protein [Curvibacter sp.]
MSRFLRLLALLVGLASGPAWATFADNGDGTVSDTVTGLMWDKCSWGSTDYTNCQASYFAWQQALASAVTANSRNYKGYNDWRLPNITELESLVIPGVYPRFNRIAFPDMDAYYYWSSTVNIGTNPPFVWIVDFGTGYVDIRPPSRSDTRVRLVRSGRPFAAFDSLAPVRRTTSAATAAGSGTVSAQIVSGSAGCSIDTANSGPYALPAYNGAPPPLGGMKIRVTGCNLGETVTVAVTFSALSSLAGPVTFMKYGKTPASPATPVWYAPNGVSISGNTITYQITDNGLGDDTFTGPDGIINDPGGPVLGLSDPAGIPALNEWGLAALTGVMVVFAAGAVRRRRMPH